jgi:hypothetical protein
MIRRPVHLLAPGIVLLAVTGCLDVQEPTVGKFAFLELHATPQGTVYSATPVALFFRGTGVLLSNSQRAVDACGDFQYPVPESRLPFPTLDAGSFVTATFGEGDPTILSPFVDDGIERYIADGPVEFVPGDTVEFSVPATTDDLEALTLRARTAEAFTPDEIDISLASGGPFPITWTQPEVTTGSMMVYEFRYASGSSQLIDRETICFLRDDGESSVSLGQIAAFANSEVRESLVTRHRITTASVAGAIIHITSTLELPLIVNVTP